MLGEIKSPLSAGLRLNFDIAWLVHRIDYARFSSKDYDFVRPTPDSQLTIEFTTRDGINCELSTVGLGCTDLLTLFETVIRPNFIEL